MRRLEGEGSEIVRAVGGMLEACRPQTMQPSCISHCRRGLGLMGIRFSKFSIDSLFTFREGQGKANERGAVGGGRGHGCRLDGAASSVGAHAMKN